MARSVRCRLLLGLAWLGWAAIPGCADPVPQGLIVENEAQAEKKLPAAEPLKPAGCRVHGRVVSSSWRDLGGGIERAIVRVETLPDLKQVDDVYGQGEEFELRLPPGKYRLTCSANGTRGATFQILTREVSVAEDKDLDIGAIDLPISKTTSLYGKQAPELDGILGWRDTKPLTMKDLRGQVVVLDFFTQYCSICHAHKPDLVKLRDKYQRQGLAVLAIHDSGLKTLEELNKKIDPILRNVFQGDPPKIPMALDGPGKQCVFESYGIYAVPAVILIDQQGRVVRRHHHAGRPELEEDVKTLLSAPPAR